MIDALDLLQCPVCGTFYVPQTTPTGQVSPHCVVPSYPPTPSRPPLSLSVVTWLTGEVHVDWSAIEARVVEGLLTEGIVGSRLTEGVVGPSLTGQFLDMEV